MKKNKSWFYFPLRKPGMFARGCAIVGEQRIGHVVFFGKMSPRLRLLKAYACYKLILSERLFPKNTLY